MILATAVMCLAANIFYEARSELIPGQYAVALVTMNRAEHDPDKVCEVVLKPHQFSWTTDKVVRLKGQAALKKPKLLVKEDEAWERAKKIARVVLSGRMSDFTGGATFYHTPEVRPAWRKAVAYRKQIGNHIFYAERKSRVM